jgi:hypothetical protein
LRLVTAPLPAPLFGADAVVWTTDIAQLDHDDALDVLAWMATALVDATLNKTPPAQEGTEHS